MEGSSSSRPQRERNVAFRALKIVNVCNQHNARDYIQSALLEKDKEKVIDILASKQGLKNLSTILSKRFSVMAGNSYQLYSFQSVAVPLCTLLSDREVSNAVRETAVNKVYMTVLRNHAFVTNYGAIVCAIIERNGIIPVDTAAINRGYNPISIYNAIEPFVNMCKIILWKLPQSASLRVWKPLIPDLHEATTEWISSTGDTSSQAREALLLLEQVMDAIRTTESHVTTNSLSNLSSSSSAGNDEEIRAFLDERPGDLRLSGPRHDNDHADFREIMPIPTHQELVAISKPYLPSQSGPLAAVSSSWINDGIESHLDTHYRLLREDMVAPIRSAVQCFLLRNVLGDIRNHQYRLRFKTPPYSDGTCFIFRNAFVKNIKISHKYGVYFNISFNQVDRRRFPEVLQPTSLVCLTFGTRKRNEDDGELDNSNPLRIPVASSSSTQTAKLVLAIVVPLDSNKSGSIPNICNSLGIKAVSVEGFEELVSRINRTRENDQPSNIENVMLTVHGHVVAGTAAVLENLKKLQTQDISWLRRVLTKDTVESTEKTEHFPAYMDCSTAYDLSFLAKPKEDEACKALQQINLVPVETFLSTLKGLRDHIILDDSQIDAFVAALTQDVALIQGPPGCGKTYLGVQIVRALLSNSTKKIYSARNRHGGTHSNTGETSRANPRLRPILVVCYTNHALDQFLECLIQSGVVQKQKVVRLGYRSKSEILKSCSLHGRAYNSRTIIERQDYGRARRPFNNIIRDLGYVNNIITGKNVIWGAKFTDWVQKDNSDLFSHIYGSRSRAHEMTPCSFEEMVDRWVKRAEYADEFCRREQCISDCKTKYLMHLAKKLDQYRRTCDILMEGLEEVNRVSHEKVLRTADIVGCTTSGAAKHSSLLRSLGAPILLCEEAGEIPEGHLISSISTATQHLILIGDHLQLRPRVSQNFLKQESGKCHDLNVSMFERLAFSKQVPVFKMRTQRRMHPKISEIPRRTLYNDLEDGEIVQQYSEQPRGFGTPLYFLDHNAPEDVWTFSSDTSKSNEFEANLICALVIYAVQQGYERHQIAVITPYMAQLKLIKRKLSENELPFYFKDGTLVHMEQVDISRGVDIEGLEMKFDLTEQVRASTVDSFQGEESDLVFISTVRCNNYGSIGFLSFENRLNVMLTRAKHGMYILGSSNTILASRAAEMFQSILGYLKEEQYLGQNLPLRCASHGNITNVSSVEKLPGDGGCLLPCKAVKKCGHRCHRRCHPDEWKHHIRGCDSDCDKSIP